MSGSRPAALCVQRLSHRYRGAEYPALDDVSFEVAPGERLGLLGPNGAGKSTLMRLCCGFLPMTAAADTRVELVGVDVRAHSRRARACVGYLPEHVPLYPELRAREHLSFRARIKGVARRARAPEIERVAECTGIGHVLDTPIAQLSRGYRQRVGVADALLGAPPVVILDEPTVGLDPNQVREVRAMLRGLGGAHTLVFSSHILAEVEMLCDRVVILAGGRVVADEDVATATSARELVVAWRAPVSVARWVLKTAGQALGGATLAIDRVKPDGQGSRAEVALGVDDPGVAEVAAEISRASHHRGAVLIELRPSRTRLEERFAEVTAGVQGRSVVAERRDKEPS